jgi:hypothetical protein
MTTFLKISSVVLNTNYIHKILITPNKYYIYLIRNNIYGINFLGTGFIHSDEHEIEVCATKHIKEYNIVSEFINKL